MSDQRSTSGAAGSARSDSSQHSIPVPSVENLRAFLLRDSRGGFIQTLDGLIEQLQAYEDEINGREESVREER